MFCCSYRSIEKSLQSSWITSTTPKDWKFFEHKRHIHGHQLKKKKDKILNSSKPTKKLNSVIAQMFSFLGIKKSEGGICGEGEEQKWEKASIDKYWIS